MTLSGPSTPLLVYDGACGFCTRWVGRVKRLTGPAVRYAPYQDVAPNLPHIPTHAFRQSVHLLHASGPPLTGAAAICRLLAFSRLPWTLLWPVYRSVPPAAWTLELAYRLIARNRAVVSRLTRAPRSHTKS